MKRVLALSLILFLLVGCKKDEPTQPQTPPLDISGTWVGTGTSETGRTVSFEISIAHTNASLSGSGKYQISGSIIPVSFSITGSCSESGSFWMFFGSSLIDFSGTATEKALSGRFKYGGMQESNSTFVRK